MPGSFIYAMNTFAIITNWLDLDVRYTAIDHPQSVRGSVRQIDNPPVDIRTAVIDFHLHRLSIR